MREQVASEQALRLSAVTAAPASGSSTTPISQQYELCTVIASIIVANLMPLVITSVMLPTAFQMGAGRPVGCHNARKLSLGWVSRDRQAALWYSLISPLTVVRRLIRAVMLMASPGSCTGG